MNRSMANTYKLGNTEARVSLPNHLSIQNLVVQPFSTSILIPDSKTVEALRTPRQRKKHARKEYDADHEAFAFYSNYGG